MAENRTAVISSERFDRTAEIDRCMAGVHARSIELHVGTTGRSTYAGASRFDRSMLETFEGSIDFFVRSLLTLFSFLLRSTSCYSL
ncbi:unnamed protein product [Microthlaspi erraticum]|uniref:Uncharacterized protein n=1 Tax=Microthlaspi erraticum TaxID=1685480 RepID=A0A6D2K6K8_9BRAS|nr:unnamed protein product [Microthlaspi erraticum]